MTSIRTVRPEDAGAWLRMRIALYGDDASLAAEIEDHLAGRGRLTVFVAERPDGQLCGFMELGPRDYAEGCSSSPVGYIEGLYLDEDVRRTGIGARFVSVAEAWAIEKGLSELASDALIDNHTSIAFHKAAGFAEVERQVCFAKRIRDR